MCIYLCVPSIFPLSRLSVLKMKSSALLIIQHWHASTCQYSTANIFSHIYNNLKVLFFYNFSLLGTNIALPKTLLKMICSSSKGGIYFIYKKIYIYTMLPKYVTSLEGMPASSATDKSLISKVNGKLFWWRPILNLPRSSRLLKRTSQGRCIHRR